MLNDKTPPKQEAVTQQETGGDCVSRLVRQSWRKRNEEMPERGQRVIAFSPVYPKGHEMRFRILDGQFLRITTEVEYWTDCEELFQSLPNAGGMARKLAAQDSDNTTDING